MPGVNLFLQEFDRPGILTAHARLHARCSCSPHFRKSRAAVTVCRALLSHSPRPTCLQQLHHPSHRKRRHAVFSCAAAGSAAATPSADSQAVPRTDGLLRALGGVLVVAALAAAFLAAGGGRGRPVFASITSAVGTLSTDRFQPTFRSGWAGLAAGCLHSLSGPDHLAALTPLTFGRGQMKATLLGALWGFGHCIGQLVLGLLLLILKDRFTQFIPALSKYSSTTVALTLVVIGALGLQETLHTRREAELQLVGTGSTGTDPATIPIPATEQQRQQHLQAQEGARRAHETLGAKPRNFSLWTLATGVVYGLQPDALFVIIPALALPTPLAAVAYMFMFVVGTVTAMGGYTAFIGATSKVLDRSNTNLLTKLSGASSGIAICVGHTATDSRSSWIQPMS